MLRSLGLGAALNPEPEADVREDCDRSRRSAATAAASFSACTARMASTSWFSDSARDDTPSSSGECMPDIPEACAGQSEAAPVEGSTTSGIAPSAAFTARDTGVGAGEDGGLGGCMGR